MPEEKAARILDNRMRVLEDYYKRSFCERGLIALEVQERQLWRWMADFDGSQYGSFDQWVIRAAPHSRSDVLAAKRAVKELRDIARDDLESMPRCNIEVLRTLSTGVRSNPEVIEAAKILPQKAFVAKMERSFPDQHVEETGFIAMPKGDADEFRRAIAMAMALGARTRAEAFKEIAVSYIQDHAAEVEHLEATA
jgi:hypothetical protein